VWDLSCGRLWMVRWDKRRLFCDERRSPRRTFVERSLSSVVSAAAADRPAAGGAGAGARVRGGPPARCREYGVSWWSVSQALVAVTAGVCRRLQAGVRMLGADETRIWTVRWLFSEERWRQPTPWMTSFVDLDTTHPVGCSLWHPASQGRHCGAGWPYRARRSATAMRSWRSTRRHRSPGRCSSCCRTRRWSSTTGTRIASPG